MADPFSSILSLTRAAVERYDMLPAGASVAVGVSGGKDSLVLLVALAAGILPHPLLPHRHHAGSGL